MTQGRKMIVRLRPRSSLPYNAALVVVFLLSSLLVGSNSLSLESANTRPSSRNIFSRRHALISLVAGTTTAPFHPQIAAWADADENIIDPADTAAAPIIFNFNSRDRNGNKLAVIREDYWYILGKTPPRLLTGPLKGADPQFNAFGTCLSSNETSGSNSCTYVALTQRIPAYNKYASSIAYGAKEFQQLGAILKEQAATKTALSGEERLWNDAETYLRQEERSPPPAAVDAELKMVLFATAMTTSPSFPGPSRELLVARFYANEVRFANQEILAAIRERDATRAMQAWEFGRDSWNSFFQVVSRSIVPKVGEKFEAIV